MTNESDVIDLTDSFTLIDHCQLANVVIELLDDSLHNSPRQNVKHAASNTSKMMKSVETVRPAQRKSYKPSTPTTSNRNEKGGFGDCPICWDTLGENPLASTKCGHVFCLPCIRQSVIQTKRCPTCRCVLKGASAYHPLYLS